ncbi:M20/M25/M40 family metallo-hydrolase [Leptolyngbyaceae cyanobacterium UHCC 1019]
MAERTDLKDRVRSHLLEIVRERDPYLATAGHFYVQQYIHDQLQQWGTVENHTFRDRGLTHTNFVLNLPAQPQFAHQPPIIIGAHYDAVPGTVGADDNASGVAALLELARLLTANPARHPVRLIAFDLEEYGMVGSSHYAKAMQQQAEPLRLMLSLEMLGYCSKAPNSQTYPPGLKYFYPDRGDFIALIGNASTISDLMHLHHAICTVGTPAQWLPAGIAGQFIPSTRLSDHSPFWDCGYRAIMVTDTAFMRNPHYHQPSDRLETLDLDFLSGVCWGLFQGLQTL